jgi:hypothetical protein
MLKLLALVFLIIAALVFFFWALPAGGADGSGWVVSILVLIALVIVLISLRNTGKALTDESGGH